MSIATAIKKNRLALLRLVVCWLAMAWCVRRTRLILPSRIGRWVYGLIFSAETACGILMIACGYEVGTCVAADRMYLKIAHRYRAGLDASYSDDCFSIDAIIERLKALRSALKRLAYKVKPAAKVCAVSRFSMDRGFQHVAAQICVCPLAQPVPP